MYLKLDTQFNPFTYDEMVKPLLYYKQAYDAAEASYADLAQQTEAWKDAVNRENSPEAFEMYQRYSGDLNNIVDDFSRGMNARNRSQLLNMKRRYAQDIQPIANASAALKEANDLRVKAGPDAIFEVNGYNSLDDFLHGKVANNKYQSKDALTKKTAAITEAAMAQALQDPEFKKAMGDQFWQITQHTGGSYKDLMEAIQGNAVAQNKFAEIKAQMMRDAGYDSYDAIGQRNIEDAINTGLYAGLDKPVRSFQANADHMTPAQKASISLQRDQLALSAAGSGMTKVDGKWIYDPDKDPSLSKAIAVAALKAQGKNTLSQTLMKFAMPKNDISVDIKNPEKSEYFDSKNSDNKEYLKGATINYAKLQEVKRDKNGTPIKVNNRTVPIYGELNATVAYKTAGKYKTLKEAIDARIKQEYPNANDKELDVIAKTYFTYIVDDNGNFRMIGKNISALNPAKIDFGNDSSDSSSSSSSEGYSTGVEPVD
jgi:hypothetical protein